VRTKPAAWHGTLLAIFVICCAQLVVAENLVCLAYLSSCKPRSPSKVLI
jgi:hypothetical protein